MHSQTDSNKCIIPCYVLKNALIVKAERDYLKNTIIPFTQDSIKTYIFINKSQDTIIKNDSNIIHKFYQNERKYDTIIFNQGLQTDLYKKLYIREKKYKYIGFGTSILILGLLWKN